MDINVGGVSRMCRKLYKTQTAPLKKNGQKYTFISHSELKERFIKAVNADGMQNIVNKYHVPNVTQVLRDNRLNKK